LIAAESSISGPASEELLRTFGRSALGARTRAFNEPSAPERCRGPGDEAVSRGTMMAAYEAPASRRGRVGSGNRGRPRVDRCLGAGDDSEPAAPEAIAGTVAAERARAASTAYDEQQADGHDGGADGAASALTARAAFVARLVTTC